MQFRLVIIFIFLVSNLFGTNVRINDKGVVVETETMRMWQDNNAVNHMQNYQSAEQYCKNLTLAGYDDWLLPGPYASNPMKFHDQFMYKQSTWSGAYEYTKRGYKVFHLYPTEYNQDMTIPEAATYYTRCFRYGNGKTYFTFKSMLGIGEYSDYSIALTNTRGKNEVLLIDQNKVFLGTKTSILNDFNLSISYSTDPFKTVEKLSQMQINNSIVIPRIEEPKYPEPIKLVKDEFESKKEFELRVEKENIKREEIIADMKKQYMEKVNIINNEFSERIKNLEVLKHEIVMKNFSIAMGEPVISYPVYDAETDLMTFDVAMSNANWKKKVSFKVPDRQDARSMKERLNDLLLIEIKFSYEDEAIVLKDIIVSLGVKETKYFALLDEKDREPVKINLESQKNDKKELIKLKK